MIKKLRRAKRNQRKRNQLHLLRKKNRYLRKKMIMAKRKRSRSRNKIKIVKKIGINSSLMRIIIQSQRAFYLFFWQELQDITC
jgi:hypothetical protein